MRMEYPEMHEYARAVVEQIILQLALGRTGPYHAGGVELLEVVLLCGRAAEHT
jgi:hypothetical protein